MEDSQTCGGEEGIGTMIELGRYRVAVYLFNKFYGNIDVLQGSYSSTSYVSPIIVSRRS